MSRYTGTRAGETRKLIRLPLALAADLNSHALRRAEYDRAYAARVIRPDGTVKVSTAIVVILQEVLR